MSGHVKSVGETFTLGASSKNNGLLRMMEKASWRNVAAKWKGRGRKNNNKKHKTERKIQFMHTKHTKI